MAEVGRHLLRSFSLWFQGCCFVISWAQCPCISHQLQINEHCMGMCTKHQETGHWLSLIKRTVVYSPKHLSFAFRRQSSKQKLVRRRIRAARSKGGNHSVVTFSPSLVCSIFSLLIVSSSHRVCLTHNTPRQLYRSALELLGSKNSTDSEKGHTSLAHVY